MYLIFISNIPSKFYSACSLSFIKSNSSNVTKYQFVNVLDHRTNSNYKVSTNRQIKHKHTKPKHITKHMVQQQQQNKSNGVTTAHIFPSDYTTLLFMHLLTHSLRRFNEKHLWHAYFGNNTYFKLVKNTAEQKRKIHPSLENSKKKKVKQSLLQTWTDPEGFRRTRFADFMTVGT